MDGHARIASFQSQASAAFGIAGCKTQVGLAANAAFCAKQCLPWNPVVDHVHGAANGAAAVQQRAGPPQHFNALHADGVAGHGVVKTQTRGVDAGTAVLKDADAVTVESSNDWPARVGAKVATADARCAVQRLTQCGLRAHQQPGARVPGGRRDGVRGAKGVASDGDFFQCCNALLLPLGLAAQNHERRSARRKACE